MFVTASALLRNLLFDGRLNKLKNTFLYMHVKSWPLGCSGSETSCSCREPKSLSQPLVVVKVINCSENHFQTARSTPCFEACNWVWLESGLSELAITLVSLVTFYFLLLVTRGALSVLPAAGFFWLYYLICVPSTYTTVPLIFGPLLLRICPFSTGVSPRPGRLGVFLLGGWICWGCLHN